LVFLAWTLVTLEEQAEMGFWEDGGGLSVRLDHTKSDFLTETVFEIVEEIDTSLPQAERREAVRERVEFYLWSSVENFTITTFKMNSLLNERHGWCGDSPFVVSRE
jgi:hypothetical protein